MHLSAYLRAVSSSGVLANALASLPRSGTDWASLRCPPDSKSTLPTPTYGDTDAVFTVCTEELIHAPVGRHHPFCPCGFFTFHVLGYSTAHPFGGRARWLTRNCI